MRKNKRYQDQDEGRGQNKKYKQKDCQSQFLCENLLLLNKCKFPHKQDDFNLSKQYQKLKMLKRFVIIFEYQKDNKQEHMRATSLNSPLLPLQIVQEIMQKVEQNKQKLQGLEQSTQQNKQVGIKKCRSPGIYYQAQFLGPNLSLKKINIKIVKQISKFGSLIDQIQIIKTLKQPQFNFPKILDDKQLQTGIVKMNWQRIKVLKNNSGVDKPIYLDDYNQKQYPFIEGCNVKYTTRKGKGRQFLEKVYSVKYDKFRFTGILKVDQHGVFYIKSRNWKHQTIDVSAIPEALKLQAKQIQNCFPFTLLKPTSKSKNQVTTINSILSKFLVKGQFYDWPQHFYQPIGILEEQFSLLSLKGLKQAVIYQYRINQPKATQKQKKQSQKLLKDLQISEKKDNQKQDIQVFTVDGLGTSCHDDALSIKKIDQQQKSYSVGIHIADVDQYVPHNCNLNDQIKKKDKTMYIRGFYSPMFSIPLLKYFSLSEGNNKLAYSLFFNIDQKGLIDFKSIQFKQTCVKVVKNYFHNKNLGMISQLQNFLGLNRLIQQSNLLSQNNLALNEQSQTQGAIQSLMLISSMIPTFMWKINSERIKNTKKNVDQFIEKVVKQLKQNIKQWQKKMKLIKQTQKKMSILNEEKRKINTKIQKQAQNQVKKLKQVQKQQKKAEKQKKKKEKMENKQKSKEKLTTEQQKEESTESQQEQQKDEKTVTQISMSQKKQIQNEIKQMKQQEERQKKLKQTLTKQVKIGKKKLQEEQQSSSEDSQIQVDKQDYERKKNQAKRALNGYLSKVFEILNVDIKWKSREEIREKFQQAKKFDKSQIFKQFMKRMYIMNHQHFKYIIQLKKQQNKKTANQNNTTEKNKYKGKEQAKYKQHHIQQSKKQQIKVQKTKYKEATENIKGAKIEEKIEQKNSNIIIKQKSNINKNAQRVKQILIKPFQQNKNQLKKRQIRDQGLAAGKKWAKSNDFSHLLFKLFSSLQQDLIKENFIKFEPSQNQQNLSAQFQAQFLKFILIGIQARQQLKIPEKQKKQLSKKSKQLAQLSFTEHKKNKEISFEQFLKQQIQKLKQLYQGKNLESKKIIQNAKYIKQLRKINEKKQKQPKQQKQQKQTETSKKMQQELIKNHKQQELTKQQACQNIKKQQKVQKHQKHQKKQKNYLTKQEIKSLIQIYMQYYKARQAQFYESLLLNSQNGKRQKEENIQQKKEEQKQQKISIQKMLKKIDYKKYLIFKIQDFFTDSEQLNKLIDQQVQNIKPQNNQTSLKYRNIIKSHLKQQIYSQLLNNKDIDYLNKQAQRHLKYILKQQQKLLKKQSKIEQTANIGLSNDKICEEKCKKMKQFLLDIQVKFISKDQAFYFIQRLQKLLFNKYFLMNKKFKFVKTVTDNRKQQENKEQKSTKVQQLEKDSRQKKIYQQAISQKDKEKSTNNIQTQKNQELNTQINIQASKQNKSIQQIKQINLKQNITKIDELTQKKIQQPESLIQKKNPNKKMSKKQQKKFWEEKKKQIIVLLKEKYEKDLGIKQEQVSTLKKSQQIQKGQLKKSLQNIQSQYNILDYMIQKMKKKQKKKSKKSKRDKKQEKNKKDEEDSDAQNCEYIQNVFDLIQQYRKKSGHTFKTWKVSQIQKFLSQKIDTNDKLINDSQKLNKQFSKLSKDEQQLLKWNNPIRSYDALQTMRIIKDCEWVFNGKISPLDILIDYKALKIIKSRINSLEKSKLQKRESQQSDKKHKQASRQIQKIEFYYKVKNRPDQQYEFLNVTSPHQSVKFVFHPTLGQIQVFNKNFKQQIFRPVKGKIKIVSEFPIQINAVLFE